MAFAKKCSSASLIEKDKAELKVLQNLIERRMKDLDWKISGERNEMTFNYNDVESQLTDHINNQLASANDNAVENYRLAVSNDHQNVNQLVKDKCDQLLDIAVSGLTEFPPVVKPTFTEHNTLKAKLARTLIHIRQQLVTKHGLSGKVDNPKFSPKDGDPSSGSLQADCDKAVELLGLLKRNFTAHNRAAAAKTLEVRRRVDLAAANLKNVAQAPSAVTSQKVVTDHVVNLFHKDLQEVAAMGNKVQNTQVRDEVKKVKVDVAYVLEQLPIIRKKYN